jgi:hypothetical protein
MCVTKSCKDRLSCFRYMAEPNKFGQTYSGFFPKNGEDHCDHFWPLKDATTKLREEVLDELAEEGQRLGVGYEKPSV